ncbi:hypothetical protein PSN45_005142 [Yamadazyma tenuis]|uniref:Major facilitator superfamily (MFS) profile domain-containing protein n=1 Tax=Candida tenuis (strain ATCC 10573 / BCRC 21748 / CBS 615 / JCM 9827 / NBRC 10315 / NRRL Y-1498 / VKM Y-70) TaxID=590646 RepID=G3B0S6_CANTC|nr:uncharacterized protein CANTEDRAFT_120789 [Yamadazyma tenuis ATCC 10573]EGV64791.1 hypothetical protein CANTEDRAFT_120789 [Yamadazyma tenuis ATCC 10573]WEJ97586.1 hypothetical protein PSN45_005142 [Yamadazyma tenuis]
MSVVDTKDLEKQTDEPEAGEEKQGSSDDASSSDYMVISDDDPKYTRFSPRRKSLFVFIISLAVFLAPSSTVAFLPAISNIAEEFGTTQTIINISNACYCVMMAISPCVTSPLGDIYGRRIMFLICCFGFTVSTILVAVSQNLAMFIVFRLCSAFFGVAFFPLGGSIVSDIYIPKERGNAMGWTLSGSQLGPAFAPCIGGVIITYTTWRVIFWVLAGVGGVALGTAFVFLKETATVKKCEVYKKEHPGKNQIGRFVWVPYNPFQVVRAFKYPNLILGGYMSMTLLYNMYGLLTPIRNVIDPRFNLTTPVYGSLFYLAPGMGYLIGSLVGGKWADYYVRKFEKMRGERIPEDRLRSTYVSFGFVLPVSVLIFGWSIDKEVGGMALPIITLFFNGVAQTFCFPSINAYCVDCLPHLGGDAIASNYFARYIAGAVGSATCLMQINTIGVGWTNTISSFLLFSGFCCTLVLIRFGGKMRENVTKNMKS